jgi:lipoprotein-releasing system permease protein
VVKGFSDTAHHHLMHVTHRTNPYFTSETIAAGEILANRTNLYAEKQVKLFSPELISLGLESLSQPYLIPMLGIPETRVTSVFSLQKIFDDRYVLTSNLFAQKILLLGRGEYSGIDIRPKEGYSSDAVTLNLRQWLAKSPMKSAWKVRTLEEKYTNIFTVMQLEKWASFSILMLIILVASLSLTGALAMTAIDKQRELFYLRCLGLEKPQFMSIFIIQGGITGITGTIAGTTIAWTICKLQELYGIVQLPSKSAFIIPAYPVSINLADFVIVAISSITLCLLVSLYPAQKAAKIAATKTQKTT